MRLSWHRDPFVVMGSTHSVMFSYRSLDGNKLCRHFKDGNKRRLFFNSSWSSRHEGNLDKPTTRTRQRGSHQGQPQSLPVSSHPHSPFQNGQPGLRQTGPFAKVPFSAKTQLLPAECASRRPNCEFRKRERHSTSMAGRTAYRKHAALPTVMGLRKVSIPTRNINIMHSHCAISDVILAGT